MSEDERLWSLYACAECAPGVADPALGDEDWPEPYVVLIPAGEKVPTFCPRCDAYYSLLAMEGTWIVAQVPLPGMGNPIPRETRGG